jgi:lysophospholipase L1-like esterase
VFGGAPQVRALADVDQASAVLLSIGGNDAGFGEIGKGCATPGRRDCRNRADEWVKRLDQTVYPSLVKTFSAVRQAARGAEVFVMTYPDPLGKKLCREMPLNTGEFNFIRETFIPRLNEIIRFAAKVSSVRVIDVEDAFVGHRICEVRLGRAAANVLGFRRTFGNGIDIREWAHNSFHPNELGHRLIADHVTSEIRSMTAGNLQPLEPPPSPGASPPPFVPDEIRVPIGPYPFPSGTACRGSEISTIVPARVGADAPRFVSIRLDDVAPTSTICFREYKGKWQSTYASARGSATVQARVDMPGIASINEIIYHTTKNTWVKVVVRKANTDAPQ